MSVDISDKRLRELASTRLGGIKHIAHVYLSITSLLHNDTPLLPAERHILQHFIAAEKDTLKNTCYCFGQVYYPCSTRHETVKVR